MFFFKRKWSEPSPRGTWAVPIGYTPWSRSRVRRPRVGPSAGTPPRRQAGVGWGLLGLLRSNAASAVRLQHECCVCRMCFHPRRAGSASSVEHPRAHQAPHCPPRPPLSAATGAGPGLSTSPGPDRRLAPAGLRVPWDIPLHPGVTGSRFTDPMRRGPLARDSRTIRFSSASNALTHGTSGPNRASGCTG